MTYTLRLLAVTFFAFASACVLFGCTPPTAPTKPPSFTSQGSQFSVVGPDGRLTPAPGLTPEEQLFAETGRRTGSLAPKPTQVEPRD